ncbi:MAG: hypothetical protein UX17_C0029G0020 [Parcubacteria group bacterium GW2011_GWC2_45_7]|nr:MAG: hypothetical protein UX17_C0029G0020 [Parcubacteria group bacterium GW2011_GWC2_45_7]KKU73548.1 MAG: hypothetical protein UX98_C0006G0046 [Parcubacteria group bacterium GW2011_GWA2_47_26]
MKTGSKILIIILGTIAFGVVLVSSLPLAQRIFHLSFYCVPEKVFKEDSREWQRSWHNNNDEECRGDEIKKQFLKYTLFKKDSPFEVGDIVAYKRNGKLFGKAFGRIEEVSTLDAGWSYEVLTVVDSQVFTEKVMHDWIFARD